MTGGMTVELTCAALTRWPALLDSVKESLPGVTGLLSASAIRSCSVRAQWSAASAPPAAPCFSNSENALFGTPSRATAPEAAKRSNG